MADRVHEDGDCLLCGDGPKPPPPELYPWPVRAWARVWAYLSWPWQVRQFRACGFRRVGWMTWETGPVPRLEATGPLSVAALDVRHELERLAGEHPEASGPELAAMLARRYCPARLKRGER